MSTKDRTSQEALFAAEAKPPEYKLDSDQHAFELDPIRGFPELRWAGKRPFRSIPYYPAELRESYPQGEAGTPHRIYLGDNLQVLAHLLRDFRQKVRLVYIDPPFDSRADYTKTVKLRRKSASSDPNIFEEKQYTDIWTNDEYLQFMYERLILLRELLADNGSIYLHCDYHQSHRLRCILDEVFGPENFRAEIAWKRTSAHADAANFGVVHDTILFYTKTRSYVWNNPKTSYEDWYVERYYRYSDDDGRKFMSDNLSASGLAGGGYTYVWNGVERTWRCPESTMQRLHDEGRVYYTKNGIARYKRYLDEMEGRPVQTLWDDIQSVVSWSDERTDYPTQKPENLVRRIVEASSNPGDIVLDCFVGSGTTAAVAMKLGRRFVGGDINSAAVRTTTDRLLRGRRAEEEKELGLTASYMRSVEVWTVNHYDLFRNPAQARDLLVEALAVQPVQGNSLYDGEKDGRLVKIMPVNRIATRQDLNELITNFNYKLFEKRKQEAPNKPVERLLIVCMGHEPDLKAHLQEQVPYKLDVEVVDILRDRADLEFKRDSEARVRVVDGELVIEAFYPMALLQKLSVMKEDVGEWRELVDSVLVDFNYDGVVMQPAVVDVPDRGDLVSGRYPVPEDAGTIRVRITDVLSESWEGEVQDG